MEYGPKTASPAPAWETGYAQSEEAIRWQRNAQNVMAFATTLCDSPAVYGPPATLADYSVSYTINIYGNY